MRDLTKKEMESTNGGYVGIVVGVFCAFAIWAYDFGKDAAERERRNKH
jgi:lactobin A/cerein 7B family class IIb bacteriocin